MERKGIHHVYCVYSAKQRVWDFEKAVDEWESLFFTRKSINNQTLSKFFIWLKQEMVNVANLQKKKRLIYTLNALPHNKWIYFKNNFSEIFLMKDGLDTLLIFKWGFSQWHGFVFSLSFIFCLRFLTDSILLLFAGIKLCFTQLLDLSWTELT